MILIGRYYLVINVVCYNLIEGFLGELDMLLFLVEILDGCVICLMLLIFLVD